MDSPVSCGLALATDVILVHWLCFLALNSRLLCVRLCQSGSLRGYRIALSCHVKSPLPSLRRRRVSREISTP